MGQESQAREFSPFKDGKGSSPPKTPSDVLLLGNSNLINEVFCLEMI